MQSRYYQVNEKIYCEDCKEKDLPQCGVCEEALTGQYVTVNGKNLIKVNVLRVLIKCLDDKLHLECFVCSVCKEPIKGKFYKDKETGKYLCISDYQVAKDPELQ